MFLWPVVLALTPQEYVVMDLGTAMDARTLQTEATYQLIVRWHHCIH